MQKIFFTSVFGAVLLFAAPSSGQYPDPEEIGFANCILIYEQENRGPDEFKPYVAARFDGELYWGFDAFLFLTLYHEGHETSYLKSDKTLWLHWLDRYFRPGMDIDALNQAAESFGVSPPTKRKVVIAIPWMSDEVTDFGDVDGDGVSENLSRKADRAKVARWYIDLAKEKFRQGNYRNLELWGFYWMREDLVKDQDNARLVADIVHEKNCKIMWIPYYYAPGWDKWKELGMDVAIMQSSYPFRSWIDRGCVRPNRIRAVADATRENGLGVEVEGRGLQTPEERRMLLEIMAGGYREGFQFGTQAYFLGYDVVERLAGSTDPEEREIYRSLYDYLNNREVKPDNSRQPAEWEIFDGDRPNQVVAEASLPAAATVSLLDVFFQDADTLDPWLGRLEVFVKESPDGDWLPAGWAIAGNQDTYSDQRGAYERGFRNVTAPVGGKPVTALRAILTGQQRKLEKFKLSCDFFGPQLVGRENLAYRKNYETTLPSKPAMYPDNPAGNKLVDGISSSNDYSAYIGWGDEPGSFHILLDLEGKVEFNEIRIHTRGGTQEGVNFQLNPCLVLSNQAPFREMSGAGAIPDPEPMVLDYRQLVITAEHTPYSREGYLQFLLPESSTARYVAYNGGNSCWSMISEIAVLLDGRAQDIAGYRYELYPKPTVSRNDSNFADGVRLTDGAIAKRAWFGQYYGWQGAEAYEFIIDLKQEEIIRETIAWLVRDLSFGVVPPEEVVFSFSLDRQNWSTPHRAAIPASEQSWGPIPCKVELQPVPARYVKVRIRGNPDAWAWTMLSEIQVK